MRKANASGAFARDEPMFEQQVAFGRADEQCPRGAQQSRQARQRRDPASRCRNRSACFGRRSGRRFGAEQKAWIEQISLLEAHMPADSVDELISGRRRGEVPIAKSKVAAAKRVLSVSGAAGVRQRAIADVDGVDVKAVRGKPCIEQRHRDRIRLFAGRARQAQDAEKRLRYGVAAIPPGRCGPSPQTPPDGERTMSPARLPPQSTPAVSLAELRSRSRYSLRIGEIAGRIRVRTARSTADEPIEARPVPWLASGASRIRC